MIVFIYPEILHCCLSTVAFQKKNKLCHIMISSVCPDHSFLIRVAVDILLLKVWWSK